MTDRPNRFFLTDHDSVVLRERDSSVEWFRRVLALPRLRLADAEGPDPLHASAPIAEREGRVLRAVYKAEPWRVVTACFDRAWRGGRL